LESLGFCGLIELESTAGATAVHDAYALCNAPRCSGPGSQAAVTGFGPIYDTITPSVTWAAVGDSAGTRTALSSRRPGTEFEALIVHKYGGDNVHFQNTVQMADAWSAPASIRDEGYTRRKRTPSAAQERKQISKGLTEFFEKNLK